MINLCFPPDTFTFISQAHGTTSWLGHCITTTAGESLIGNLSVLNDIACSDHLPLCIDVNCDISPLYDNNFADKSISSKWHIATDIHKQSYHKCTGELLNRIVLPTEALLCKDIIATLILWILSTVMVILYLPSN